MARISADKAPDQAAAHSVADSVANPAAHSAARSVTHSAAQPTAVAAPATDLPESGQIGQNIAAVHEFYTREEQKMSASQRHAERIGSFVGQPAFLLVILIFVSGWMAVNLALPGLGWLAFDPAPFFWLQGIVGLGALLTTTTVLMKQNRVAKLGEKRDHLDLKVTLLIEQKTAKLIDLLEELRRDLPNVKNRHDSDAAEMQQAMSPEGVLAALDENVTSPDGSTAAASAAPPGTAPAASLAA
jgi:uncharacterized membrane protein